MGNVYFIQAGERVKIGFARDVPARLAQLQTGNACALKLLAVIPNATQALERRLHRFFAEQRQRGEWFGLSGKMAVLIKSIREGAVPRTDAEIEHYASLPWHRAPSSKEPPTAEQKELQSARGKRIAEVRRAAKDASRTWADIRAEFLVRGPLYEEAVTIFERRGLRQVRKCDGLH